MAPWGTIRSRCSKRSSRSTVNARSRPFQTFQSFNRVAPFKTFKSQDWDKGMTFREFLKRRNEQQRVNGEQALGFKDVLA